VAAVHRTVGTQGKYLIEKLDFFNTVIFEEDLMTAQR
jgi:hypothetical protein